MMNRQEVEDRIGEYRSIRSNPASDESALAEAALFVEEVFGLTLTDEEINPDILGSTAAIEQYVLSKLELDN
jgi:hypothetical protein